MSQDLTAIENFIISVQKEIVPDKRVAVFDITIEKKDQAILLNGSVSKAEVKEILMKKLSDKFNLSFIDNIKVLPDDKLGEKIYGIINLSVANLRSKPDHNQELATQALLGTPVKILKEQGGFYLIQTPNEYLGWVDDDAVQLMTKKDFDQWNKSEKIIYKNIFGLVREKPSLKSIIVSDIVAGCLMKKSGLKKKWYEVEFPDGRKGYIPKDEAEDFGLWLKNIKPKAKDILSTAFSFIGFPYLWGGTSTKGMDCSGFTGITYYLNGVILPRDANQQALIGVEIKIDSNFSELKAGDLLFFGRKATNETAERVTHVGIYIGDKDYIHSSGRVRINSFDKNKSIYNAYRHKSLLRAKRLLETKELEKYLINNNNFYFNYENK